MFYRIIQNCRRVCSFAACLLGTAVAITAQQGPPSSQSVTLAWDASPDADVTGYYLYSGVVGTAQTNVLNVAAALTATVSNLLPGSTYFFTVTAYNADEIESEPSNFITYTPTITAPIPAPVAWLKPGAIVYGTGLGMGQLSATSSVAGDFLYDPPAGTVLNAGVAHVLSATFIPLDGDRYATVHTNVNLDVLQKSLIVAVQDATKLYGAALPSLTAGYSGFVNGDTAASLSSPPNLATAATVVGGVGTYPITASGAAASNYTISYMPGTLTVNPATLRITANSTKKRYADPLPPLTASYSGFVNGDRANNLTVQASLNTSATASSPAGNYPINASGATSSNYTINYVAGTLTVLGRSSKDSGIDPNMRFLTPQIFAGNVRLTWSSAPGQTFAIDWKSSLSEPEWKPLSPAITAEGNVTSWSHPLTNNSAFYRLIVYSL